MANPSSHTPHTPRSPPRADARRQTSPGEDPGTLTDEEYLSVGGPDALDSAAPGDDRTDDGVDDSADAHADSPPQSQQPVAGEDPERPGAGSRR